MRTALILAAALFTVAGPVPAEILLVAVLAAHVVRSPDRLFDAVFLVALCGIGYLAG